MLRNKLLKFICKKFLCKIYSCKNIELLYQLVKLNIGPGVLSQLNPRVSAVHSKYSRHCDAISYSHCFESCLLHWPSISLPLARKEQLKMAQIRVPLHPYGRPGRHSVLFRMKQQIQDFHLFPAMCLTFAFTLSVT